MADAFDELWESARRSTGYDTAQAAGPSSPAVTAPAADAFDAAWSQSLKAVGMRAVAPIVDQVVPSHQPNPRTDPTSPDYQMVLDPQHEVGTDIPYHLTPEAQLINAIPGAAQLRPVGRALLDVNDMIAKTAEALDSSVTPDQMADPNRQNRYTRAQAMNERARKSRLFTPLQDEVNHPLAGEIVQSAAASAALPVALAAVGVPATVAAIPTVGLFAGAQYSDALGKAKREGLNDTAARVEAGIEGISEGAWEYISDMALLGPLGRGVTKSAAKAIAEATAKRRAGSISAMAFKDVLKGNLTKDFVKSFLMETGTELGNTATQFGARKVFGIQEDTDSKTGAPMTLGAELAKTAQVAGGVSGIYGTLAAALGVKGANHAREVLSSPDVDRRTRAAMKDQVVGELRQLGLKTEAALLDSDWGNRIDKGLPIPLDQQGRDETDPRAQVSSPEDLVAKTITYADRAAAARDQAPAATPGPAVTQKDPASLLSFLQGQLEQTGLAPDTVVLTPPANLTKDQKTVQQQYAERGFNVHFFDVTDGRPAAAVSGGPTTFFLPSNLKGAEQLFKAAHEAGHGLDARPGIATQTGETREAIAQAMPEDEYAGRAFQLEVDRAAAGLPEATPAIEFDELVQDVRGEVGQVAGLDPKTASKRAARWAATVAEADPTRWERTKEKIARIAASIGLPGAQAPDPRRGTTEQWGRVAAAIISENHAAGHQAKTVVRQRLVAALSQLPAMQESGVRAAGSDQYQKWKSNAAQAAPAAAVAASPAEPRGRRGLTRFGKPFTPPQPLDDIPLVELAKASPEKQELWRRALRLKIDQPWTLSEVVLRDAIAAEARRGKAASTPTVPSVAAQDATSAPPPAEGMAPGEIASGQASSAAETAPAPAPSPAEASDRRGWEGGGAGVVPEGWEPDPTGKRVYRKKKPQNSPEPPEAAIGREEMKKRRAFGKGKKTDAGGAVFNVGEIVNHNSFDEPMRVVKKEGPGYVRVVPARQRGSENSTRADVNALTRVTGPAEPKLSLPSSSSELRQLEEESYGPRRAMIAEARVAAERRERESNRRTGSQPSEFGGGEISAKFSLDTYRQPAWSRRLREEAVRAGYGDEVVDNVLGTLEAAAQMFERHPAILPGRGARGAKGNPLKGNADFYRTLDINRLCRRTQRYYATISSIQERVGHLLSPDEMISLAQEMRAKGDISFCTFCYVEAGRRMRRYLEKLFLEAEATDIPKGRLNTLRSLLPARNRSLKDLGISKQDFQTAVSSAARTREFLEQHGAKGQALLDMFEKYALGAKGTLILPNGTYGHQLLRWSKELVDEFNSRAGLRAFSATDLDPTQIMDLNQALADAMVKGLAMHGYSKDAFTALIYGRTGLKINLSVAADGRKGFKADTFNGMDWDLAKRLRKEYPDAGTIFVAKNREQLDWALKQDWIDYVIPHHAANWGFEGERRYSALDLEELADGQREEWADPKGHPGQSPKDVHGSALWYTGFLRRAGNDEAKAVRAYLAFCDKNGIIPRVDRYRGHPGYAKLLKDYARTDSPQRPVDASLIDRGRMTEYLQQFVDRGGFTGDQTVDPEFVDEFVGKMEAGTVGTVEAIAAREQELAKERPLARETQTVRRIFGKVRGGAVASETEAVAGKFSVPSGHQFRPVLDLSGDELGNFGDDMHALRKAAVDWYRLNLQRQGPAHRDDLDDILFTRMGMKEFAHFGADPAKMKMVVALRQIIEQGEYQGPRELEHKRNDGIVRFHPIDADVTLEGRDYRVRVLIGEDKFQNKFFDLFPNIEEYKTRKALRGFAADKPSAGSPEGRSGSVAAPGKNIAPPAKDVNGTEPPVKTSLPSARPGARPFSSEDGAEAPAVTDRIRRAFGKRGVTVARFVENAIKYWPAGGKPPEDILSGIPEGAEILQRVERTWAESHRRAATWMRPLTVAYQALNRADRKYVTRHFVRAYEEGGVGQSWPSEAVQSFAEAWRDVNDTVAAEAGQLIESFAGRDPDNYVPHRLTDEGRTALEKKAGPEWEALREAAEVAGIDIHVLEGIRQDPLRQSKYGSIDYARIAELPWEVTLPDGTVVPILETDPTLLFAHVRSAARRLSTVEEFGGDEASSDYLDQTAAGLIASGGMKFDEAKDALSRIWNRLEGKDARADQQLDEMTHGLWKVVDSIVASLSLSGAVIGNVVGGHLPQSVRMGFGDTARAFAEAYTTSLKNPDLAELHALVDLEGDLLQELADTETLSGRAAKGAGTLLRATGFVAANRRINLAVAVAMQRRNLDLMLDAIRQDKDSVWERRWGKDAGAARRYLQEELKFSEADVERMVLEGPSDKDMSRAIGKQLELVNAMNESPGSRPRWVAHPLWRMAFAYSTFVRKMYDTTKYTVNEAKAGNVRPLATLILAGAPTAAAMAAIKNWLKDREDEDEGFWDGLLGFLTETGALGLAGSFRYAIARMNDPKADFFTDTFKPPHLEVGWKVGKGAALAVRDMDIKPLWKGLASAGSGIDIIDKQMTRRGILPSRKTITDEDTGESVTATRRQREYAERLIDQVYVRRTTRAGVVRNPLDPVPSKFRPATTRRLVADLRADGLTDEQILTLIEDARARRAREK
jgi:uncharacterized protein YejL (UPF0352 family)